MTPEQAERLVRIEERVAALTDKVDSRLAQLENEVEDLKKSQSKLWVIAAGVAGGSSAVINAVAGFM